MRRVHVRHAALSTAPAAALCGLCGLLLAAACGGGGPAGRPDAPVTDRAVIDSLFAPFAGPRAPGASVLVTRGGRPLLRQSFGLADVEAQVRATPETNYRLASLSKQFTATAILLLARDGKLTLATPARSILRELPAYAGGVTIRHLLTHTSGLWDYEDFVPDTQSTQVHDDDALALVRTHADSLYFAPGSTWRYSNTGYALLALIVERVSSIPFPDFLRERVFAPAGMTNTVAHVEGRDTVRRRAYGHTVRGDSVERTDQSATSAVLGDGGIYSSIDDLARWDSVLAHGGLVGDSLSREATTPYVLSGGAATAYGYGWFVEEHLGRRCLRHHGETRGFTNAISRYPDDSLTIIVLTNRTGAEPWRIADALFEHYRAPGRD